MCCVKILSVSQSDVQLSAEPTHSPYYELYSFWPHAMHVIMLFDIIFRGLIDLYRLSSSS